MLASVPEQLNCMSPRMSTWRAVHRGDRPAVGDDDRIVVEQLVELVRHDLRLHRRVASGVPRSCISSRHSLMPFCAASRNLLLSFFLSSGSSSDRTRLAVADEPDIDRIAQADPLGIELDLHRLRLARLRVIFDVGEGRADDQQGVAAFQRFLRRLGAEQPDAAGRVGALVGHGFLAEQRLADGCLQPLGDGEQLLPSRRSTRVRRG